MTRREDRDRGSITLWCLGLCLLILSIGAVTIDVWRAFSARRALASTADAAAQAGANGIDIAYYGETGVVRLDPPRAEQFADLSMAHQADTPGLVGFDRYADTQRITVQVRGTVDLGLLGLFADEPFEITVTAVGAVPPTLPPP
jgi:Flp pilus assembly protein TadG